MRWYKLGMSERELDGLDASQRAAAKLHRKIEKALKGAPDRLIAMALEIRSPGLVWRLAATLQKQGQQPTDYSLPFPTIAPNDEF